MAHNEHFNILHQGVDAWNKWRENNPNIRPDLSEITIRAYLRGFDLREADLKHSNLRGCDLYHVWLQNADLQSTNFQGAFLSDANLSEAKLQNADLREANLSGADLSGANLTKADVRGANLLNAKLIDTVLCGADLSYCNLVGCSLSGADLTGCRVFGVSAWGVFTDKSTIQKGIIITQAGYQEITVDYLEIAQFVYLLLHNEKIRDAITTIGQKAVLILGRFALPERKEILEGMREFLRNKGFLPIVFDFEKSAERDFTETIKVLAGMSLFVIADITNPKSSPLELQATIPDYMIPFVTIIQAGEQPFAMFVDLQHKYHWVLDAREYQDKKHLLSNFENGVIRPALDKHNELITLKNEALKIRSIDEI